MVASPQIVVPPTADEAPISSATPATPAPGPAPNSGTGDADNMPPPATGVTELQATPAPQREESTAAFLLEQSAQQSNRLRLAWRHADSGRQASVASALMDLESLRARVSEDVDSLELGSSPGDEAHQRLERDVSALKDALRASYAVIPPATRGLPQPSPLPPSMFLP
jgi:hypothetical protein